MQCCHTYECNAHCGFDKLSPNGLSNTFLLALLPDDLALPQLIQTAEKSG